MDLDEFGWNSSVSSDDSDFLPSEEELKESKEELKKIEACTIQDDSLVPQRLSPVEDKDRKENLWKRFLNCDSTPSNKSNATDADTEFEQNKVGDPTVCQLNEPTVGKRSLELLNSDTVHEKGASSLNSVQNDGVSSDLSVGNKRCTGLNSILKNLRNKKQKVTTLQKSMHDWNTFKNNEGIEEDLRIYNRGKGGFLERRAFLDRSDRRSFEIEKITRLSRK